MQQPITIADALPEDARGITNVLYKTWLATYPNEEHGITKEDIEESYKDVFTDENIKKQEEYLLNTPPNQKRIVAKDGGEVVGVATMFKNEDNNQLKTIYVLPEYQRKGIGTMLWEEIRKFCDPTKDTIVHVATYNESAIEFYKKLGFSGTGKRWTDEKWRMKSGGVIPEMEMVIKATEVK